MNVFQLKKQWSKLYFGMLILICWVLMIDFAIPTTAFKEKIQKVTTTQQNYYNGAGNSHLSYSLITKFRSISISKEFKKAVHVNDTIHIHKSLFLNEVNKISHEPSGRSEIYSLRWFTGMVFPLTAFLLFTMHLYKVKRISALVMIAQILVVADLIILMSRYTSRL